MVRKAVVAGMFYEDDARKLKAQLQECFIGKLGPGLPDHRTNQSILGAIVPHAGYAYSGQCAAHVYKAIAEGNPAETFIILGTNHTGLGGTSILLEDYQTPLGIATVDTELGEAILALCPHLEESRAAHSFEHSIEVQLPFLQFTLPRFRFLPIVVSNERHHAEIAEAILTAIEKTKRKVCIIASSDFTHYGEGYGYVPFPPKREAIEALDKGAIDLILQSDRQSFRNYIRKTGATICGALPIMLLLETLKTKGQLLSYYLSGDITGDYDTSVSYAGLVFKQN